MSSWLDAKCEMLHNWLEKTSVPMYAAKPEGDILWCNSAFEELTGYTNYELKNGSRTWNELTSDPDDAEADVESLSQLLLGLRDSYRMNKSLRKKNGGERKVIAHTIRYPSAGEVECILVSFVPLDAGEQMQAETISDIHKLMVDLAANNKVNWLDKVWNWATENQWKAGLIICIGLAYFLGEDFLYALRSVFEAFRGVPGPPQQ